jgi:hypothetical protein
VTQTYLNQQATTAPFASRAASAAGRLRPNAVTVQVNLTFPITRLHVQVTAAKRGEDKDTV